MEVNGINNKRRQFLRSAIAYLDKASDMISDAMSDEQDAFDNMPEGLQESERGEAMETAIDNMDDAISKIDDAKECVEASMA